MIGLSNCFHFGFTTLNWKLLYVAFFIYWRANAGAFKGAWWEELGPVLLCIVILALLWVCLRATFLSRLVIRSLSSLLLQGMGLMQRTLTLACSTSELSLSLPFSSSDSDRDSSEDMYSLAISGMYCPPQKLLWSASAPWLVLTASAQGTIKSLPY